MLKTLFRGNDDGFTFMGVIIILLVLLLLVPVMENLLSAAFQAEVETLNGRKALFEERQSELESRVEYSL